MDNFGAAEKPAKRQRGRFVMPGPLPTFNRLNASLYSFISKSYQ
jgi:hypothetical protein